ncbi:outer membrane beta-barrel protein [Aureivirga sp. CE67]|uniref:outer membrane beta-barrel protein n=1 Tax=Aureivirga sp. CE67 TaxID=1788983 RepID=UPI0018CA2DD8|nr:outer membrane beta-barrel protein [Aureivirga sp. CE67]
MKKTLFTLLFLIPFLGFSQVDLDSIDHKYREDQIYLNATYNLLLNKPTDVFQRGLSFGIGFGFIRDFPINKRRNKAIGIGLGYVFNNYIQNLYLEDNDSFEPITSFSTNRYSTSGFEIPIEYRWRTSTATKLKFWRIYTGFKASYLISRKFVHDSENNNFKIKNRDIFEKFLYGFYITAGYSSFNLHVYYELQPLFKNALVDGKSDAVKDLRIGLSFYLF